MAYEPTDAQRKEWADWLATRPASIQALGARFVPWKDYRLTTTGQRVNLRSFSEPTEADPEGTLTALCWQDWCPELTARTVFGLKPSDLVEWSEAPR